MAVRQDKEKCSILVGFHDMTRNKTAPLRLKSGALLEHSWSALIHILFLKKEHARCQNGWHNRRKVVTMRRIARVEKAAEVLETKIQLKKLIISGRWNQCNVALIRGKNLATKKTLLRRESNPQYQLFGLQRPARYRVATINNNGKRRKP